MCGTGVRTAGLRRRVADYAQWKRGWDELVAIRQEKGGVQSEQLFRNPDDPRQIAVLAEFGTAEQARAYQRSLTAACCLAWWSSRD
jgi:hypothetical protein